MNKKGILSKKVWLTFAALVFAICMGMGAAFALPAGNSAGGWTSAASSVNAGQSRANERVQMRDLFMRYPTNYVIGPIDADSDSVDSKTGKY